MAALEVVTQMHYGTEKAVSPAAEAIRHSGSLCYNCVKFKPGKTDNCPAAEDLFMAAKKWNLAMVVAQCPISMFEAAEQNFHEQTNPFDL